MKSDDLGCWHQWVNIDGEDYWDERGFPCEFAESRYGKGLMQAIRNLPGSEHLDFEQGEVEGLAMKVFLDFEQGVLLKKPCNQPATGKTSQDQLRKLYKLMGNLAEHLESLNEPTLAALRKEGFNSWKLNEVVSEQRENVRYAFGLIDPNLDRNSFETKVVARTLCEGAADVYEYVTKNKATYSTDVMTSERTGDWPDFLKAVFGIFRIKASVASQVAALSKKRNEKAAR